MVTRTEVCVIEQPDGALHLTPRYLTHPPTARCGLAVSLAARVSIRLAIPDECCTKCQADLLEEAAR